MRRSIALLALVLLRCVSLPSTSAGFKCASDTDCAAGALRCVGGLCASAPNDAGTNGGGDAGARDSGVGSGLRLAYFRADYPYAFDNLTPRELPTRGRYSSDAPTLRAQIQDLQYAQVNAGVISWYGKTTPSNSDALRVFQLGTSLEWALLYEREPLDTPTAAEIAGVLADVRNTFADVASNYLWLDGGFVVFVAPSRPDAGGCSVATRWVQGNRMAGSRAFLVLAAPNDGSSIAGCPDQPHAWRIETDAFLGETAQVSTVSPGVWPWNGPRALARDLGAFQSALLRSNDGGRPMQYVNSFNAWPDGTAVESGHTRLSDGGVGSSWASDSGMGAFLDVLHAAPFTR